jgi:hypothetical protein
MTLSLHFHALVYDSGKVQPVARLVDRVVGQVQESWRGLGERACIGDRRHYSPYVVSMV